MITHLAVLVLGFLIGVATMAFLSMTRDDTDV
jgi:hypothetical protein